MAHTFGPERRGIFNEDDRVTSSFYLKHDLDAREDEKMRALLMKLGARGYGIYWMVAEDLYRNSGRIARDYAAMAWTYHEPVKDVKAVVEDFDLFYDSNGKIGCRRVDRGLTERKEASEQARLAGRASAAKRASNASSTTVQPGEERRGKEGEDRTAAPAAADLAKELSTVVDKLGTTSGLNGEQLLELQLPFSFGDIPKGRRVLDIAPDCAKAILAKMPRLGFDLTRALRYRIKIKQDELHPRLRTA